MIRSLVGQSADPRGLPRIVAFSVEQRSNRNIRRYLHEIIEATWEAVSAAGVRIAARIKAGLCLAIVARSIESPIIICNSLHTSRCLFDGYMELLDEAISAALGALATESGRLW